jgi:hypothetical protein
VFFKTPVSFFKGFYDEPCGKRDSKIQSFKDSRVSGGDSFHANLKSLFITL